MPFYLLNNIPFEHIDKVVVVSGPVKLWCRLLLVVLVFLPGAAIILTINGYVNFTTLNFFLTSYISG